MPSPTVTTTRSVRVTDSWPVAQPPTTPNVDPFFACSLIVKIAAVSPLPAFPWVRLPSQPIPPLLGAVVNSAGASPSSPSPLSSSTYWTSDTAASPGRKNLTTYSSFGWKLPAAPPSSGETSTYPNLGLGTFGMREDGIVHDNLILCKVRHARDPPVDEPRRECIRNRERHRAQQYQQQARHFRVDGLVRPRRHRSSACWPVFHGFEHHVENTAPLDW
mmetsp:Transcript_16758/g.38391  ORF Transcript_16758/g.38391 Transcript_16758/m.38391 type:complete len:218 (-) Transcript_16758:101-754(-)